MQSNENRTLATSVLVTDDPVTIDIPVLLIPIEDRFRLNMTALELYEATRGAWRLDARHEAAQYAFSVAAGTVREVYQIDTWHRAGSTPYQSRPYTLFAIDGRWEFIGRYASEEIRRHYNGRSVARYLKQINAVRT